ncbi:MAG: polyprenyl synthetase family protein [Spirochaetes bacterium]|nr:polyprenyl synthetase family protein [Spirochaetota bacterium]
MDFIISELKELQIEEKLKNILKYTHPEKHSLEWGLNYITFSPSKRIRPLLVLESHKIFQTPDQAAYQLAACVELIHTYSLVHDDLPCMDDDELRRGLKTLHTIYDEAYALLVGDGLLTRVFSVLAQYSQVEKLPLILKYIGELAGITGMIGGQDLDLKGEGKNLSVKEIEQINRLKTGALIQLSIVLGVINGGADLEQINHFLVFGELLGHIFQIQDDILDIIGDQKLLGKAVGSDEKNQKSSLPLILGVEEARNVLDQYALKATEMVSKFPGNQHFFHQFIQFLKNRAK